MAKVKHEPQMSLLHKNVENYVRIITIDNTFTNSAEGYPEKVWAVLVIGNRTYNLGGLDCLKLQILLSQTEGFESKTSDRVHFRRFSNQSYLLTIYGDSYKLYKKQANYINKIVTYHNAYIYKADALPPPRMLEIPQSVFASWHRYVKTSRHSTYFEHATDVYSGKITLLKQIQPEFVVEKKLTLPSKVLKKLPPVKLWTKSTIPGYTFALSSNRSDGFAFTFTGEEFYHLARTLRRFAVFSKMGNDEICTIKRVQTKELCYFTGETSLYMYMVTIKGINVILCYEGMLQLCDAVLKSSLYKEMFEADYIEYRTKRISDVKEKQRIRRANDAKRASAIKKKKAKKAKKAADIQRAKTIEAQVHKDKEDFAALRAAEMVPDDGKNEPSPLKADEGAEVVTEEEAKPKKTTKTTKSAKSAKSDEGKSAKSDEVAGEEEAKPKKATKSTKTAKSTAEKKAEPDGENGEKA